MLRRKKITLGKLKIKIKPMPARQGLETVVLLSQVIHDHAPHLALIADPDRRIRIYNVLRVVREAEDLPDLLINIVSTGTGQPVDVVEGATTHEVLKALAVIVRVNKWDIIWQAAYELRIIDKERLTDWLWARVPLFRTR